MYDVLQQVEPETEKSLKDGDDEWKRMVSLKFDAMQIGSKIKCNPRTMETVRFENGSFDFDGLVKECNALNSIDKDKEANKLEHWKLYLVFMI